MSLDPSELKTGRASRNADKSEPQPKEKPEPWTVERFVDSFITSEPKNKQLVVAHARQAGIKLREIDDLVALAVDAKSIFRWAFPKDKTVYLSTGVQPVILTGDKP
jgi:hypothetical protein